MKAFLIILLITLSITRCDSGPISNEPEEHVKPTRTLYATSKIEWGSSLAELPNGDIIVSGYGKGRMLVNDATRALPYFIQIRPDGSLVRAMVVHSVGYGTLAGVKSVANKLVAVIRRYDLVDGTQGVNGSTIIGHLDFSGNVTHILSESTDWSPMKFIGADAAGILLIANWTGNRAHDLMKIGPNGSVAWSYQLPDGTFITVADTNERGDTFVFGRPSDSSFRLSRIDTFGSETWSREYLLSGSEPTPHNLAAGSDHFVTIGYTSDSDGTRHVFVTSYDLDGTINWEKECVSGFKATGGEIVVLPNNDIMLEWRESDKSEQGLPTTKKTYLMRLSSDGTEVWRESFEADYLDADVREFLVTSDNRLVILGNLETSRWENTGDIVVWQLDL